MEKKIVNPAHKKSTQSRDKCVSKRSATMLSFENEIYAKVSDDDKPSRIEFSTSSLEKLVLTKASMLQGHTTLAGFVKAVIIDRSNQIIADHNRVLTTRKDQEIFFNAIELDKEPNESLMQLFEDEEDFEEDEF